MLESWADSEANSAEKEGLEMEVWASSSVVMKPHGQLPREIALGQQDLTSDGEICRREGRKMCRHLCLLIF